MRVLVMQQKMIGDVLTSSLLAENLHRLSPGCSVHFFAHAGCHPVLAHHPHIAQVHGYPARAPWRQRRAVAGELRAWRPDVLIDAYGKPESLLLTALVRARRTIGYRKAYTRPFYSDAVARPPQATWGVPLAIEHRLRLLEPLAGPLDPASLALQPRLYVAPEEHERASAFLAAHGLDPARQPLLMVAALGSEARKTYPLPAMARLLDRIVARSDARLLFNCLPAQRAQAQALHDACAPATRARIVLDAWPPGLRDFIAVLAQCAALFGNEGGAGNMARALDVPSFSIFSPWVPQAVWGSRDGERHPSVHLAQFLPDACAGRDSAALKRAAQALYARFRPDWIEPALDAFVERWLPAR